jgi:hypothetical protein
MDTSQGEDRADGERDVPVHERPGVPRWVKIFGLIALAIAIVFVILMFLGVEHGPGLHSAASVSFGVAIPSVLQGTTA